MHKSAPLIQTLPSSPLALAQSVMGKIDVVRRLPGDPDEDPTYRLAFDLIQRTYAEQGIAVSDEDIQRYLHEKNERENPEPTPSSTQSFHEHFETGRYSSDIFASLFHRTLPGLKPLQHYRPYSDQDFEQHLMKEKRQTWAELKKTLRRPFSWRDIKTCLPVSLAMAFLSAVFTFSWQHTSGTPLMGGAEHVVFPALAFSFCWLILLNVIMVPRVFSALQTHAYAVLLNPSSPPGWLQQRVLLHYMKMKHFLTESLTHTTVYPKPGFYVSDVFLQDAEHWPVRDVEYAPYSPVPHHPEILKMIWDVNHDSTVAPIFQQWFKHAPKAPLRQCELLALWLCATHRGRHAQ